MFPGMKECLLPSCWYSSEDNGELLPAVEEADGFISQPTAKEVGTKTLHTGVNYSYISALGQ